MTPQPYQKLAEYSAQAAEEVYGEIPQWLSKESVAVVIGGLAKSYLANMLDGEMIYSHYDAHIANAVKTAAMGKRDKPGTVDELMEPLRSKSVAIAVRMKEECTIDSPELASVRQNALKAIYTRTGFNNLLSDEPRPPIRYTQKESFEAHVRTLLRLRYLDSMGFNNPDTPDARLALKWMANELHGLLGSDEIDRENMRAQPSGSIILTAGRHLNPERADENQHIVSEHVKTISGAVDTALAEN